jgi:hypothetical protein
VKSWTRPALALALTFTAAALMLPANLRAGGEPTVIGRPVPDEPGTRLLADDGYSTSVFDIDGDGVREIVRIEPRTNDPGLAQISGISVARDGTPTTLFSAPIEREVSDQEKRDVAGHRGDFTPATMGDYIGLQIIRLNGTDRLVVTVSGYTADYSTNCCLTLWAVELSDSLHGLRLLSTTGQSYDSLMPADLDGDGTDELVVTSTVPDADAPYGKLSVYQWSGSDYRRTDVRELPRLSGIYPIDSGETDGLPGAEVLMQGSADPDRPTNLLYRISLRSGVPYLETPPNGVSIEANYAVDNDMGQIVGNLSGVGVDLYRWPADSDIERVRHWDANGWPVGFIGSGADLQVLVSPFSEDYGFQLDAIGLSGDELLSIPRADRVDATRGIGQAQPYLGQTPTGLGPADSFIYAGQIVEADGPGLNVQLTPVSLMAGGNPIGTVGPDDAWTVVDTYIDTGNGHPETRLVATAALLAAHDEPLEPTFRRAALGPEGVLYTNPDPGAEAEIVVPAGSRVITTTGLTTVTVVDAPLPAGSAPGRQVTVTVPIKRSYGLSTNPFDIHLLVVTPAGNVHRGDWHVEPLLGPPDLTVRAPLSVTSSGVVTGQTSPIASVTVNGQPVSVASNGVFRAELPLALLPTDIRIVASNPLGETSETVLSILNPIDYRKLPWIPMVAVLTAVGGLIWWLRAPRRRPPSEVVPSASGTFEEIEL